MQRLPIYKALAWLNALPDDAARDVLLDCCGSPAWAVRMESERPYRMLEDLFQKSESVWFSLPPSDWLEAFSAHPAIGSSRQTERPSRSSEWSAGEQSGTASADTSTLNALAEANRLYREKFGFIFIVCATGRSADEMLQLCRSRMRNSLKTEIEIAAREQHKITELRLTKLLEYERNYDTCS